MQVVKATKCFRQVSILLSLAFSLTSIILLCVVDHDCTNSNLKVTTGLVFFLWSTVFVLLLLQAVKLTQCLKSMGKLLFGFYFFICGCMFFVQMELWGGVDNKCKNEAPVLYWWLVTNIILFYLIVSFGLATWGAYLCKVADAQEQLIKEATEEYQQHLKATGTERPDKHFMITAGPNNAPKLMQNGASAEAPSVQQMMLQNGANPYAMPAHSDATMMQYNAPQMARQSTFNQQQPMMMAPQSPMMIQQQQQQQQQMIMQQQQQSPMAMAPTPAALQQQQQQPIMMMAQAPVEQLD